MKKLIFVLLLSCVFMSCSAPHFSYDNNSSNTINYTTEDGTISINNESAITKITKKELIEKLSDGTFVIKDEIASNRCLIIYYNNRFLILAIRVSFLRGFCTYDSSPMRWNSFSKDSIKYLMTLSKRWLKEK
jgi:hypothetical protein